MYRKLKSPMNVQFELTSKCNERCRHCYNYWRRDNGADNTKNMTKEMFDRCLDELIKNNVMHVIFTGGEPFYNFDLLKYGIEKSVKSGLTVSCNSNLLLADRDKLTMLYEAGLPHILTSLNSYNPETNDFITNHPGSFKKITYSIKTAVDIGIKISTNMIITSSNINDIYKTGILSKDLGATKFHITRVVPPSYIENKDWKEFAQGHDEVQRVLEQTLELQRDCSIEIKTLIPYPLCVLKDLDRFRMYIGRPCAAGKRSMSIDARGRGHACWHMTKEYGSVIEDGLAEVWDRMEEWRSGELIPDSCRKCPYLILCGAGCRVAGEQYYGSLSAEDNIRTGWDNISKPYTGNVGVDDSIVDFDTIVNQYQESVTEELKTNIRTKKMRIKSSVRFRAENKFTVVNVGAGAGFFLSENEMKKIKQFVNGTSFSLAEIGNDERLASYLIIKGVIETL